jgi:hypothetical protein
VKKAMNVNKFAVATSMLALGLIASSVTLRAQLYDTVTVNLPYTVTVGNKTLEPGDYKIQELPSSAKSNVLMIYSDNGVKFETMAMTIPAVENQAPKDSQVILHHIGPDYYFDKIWIQGKDYGYEFPLPGSVKEREKEEAVNLAATLQSSEEQNSTTTAENTPPAATTPTPEPEPQPAAAPAPEPAPTPAPEVAQNQPTTSETPENQPTTASSEPNTANREMPHTSAGWLIMLLSGGGLSGAGWALRRRS